MWSSSLKWSCCCGAWLRLGLGSWWCGAGYPARSWLGSSWAPECLTQRPEPAWPCSGAPAPVTREEPWSWSSRCPARVQEFSLSAIYLKKYVIRIKHILLFSPEWDYKPYRMSNVLLPFLWYKVFRFLFGFTALPCSNLVRVINDLNDINDLFMFKQFGFRTLDMVYTILKWSVLT